MQGGRLAGKMKAWEENWGKSMGLYNEFIAPRLVSMACATRPIGKQRAKIIPLAYGNVVEIGIGSGLNLPYYDAARVTRVMGVDPSAAMHKMARKVSANLPFRVQHMEISGENLPLESSVADTLVVTYSLCTIKDPGRALRDMRRVLKPSGQLLFCEHGKAPDAKVYAMQGKIEPLWRRLFGGCHLTRDIPALIEKAGFRLNKMEDMYLPGTPRFVGYNWWGSARPVFD